MTTPVRIIGIDPGLVHTGVVAITFYPDSKEVRVEHEVHDGPTAQLQVGMADDVRVFIEAYRPRSNFGTDDRMVRAVSDLHNQIKGSKVLQNTGVKKVVRRPLMEALECWTFSTPTHHQDLRSAARIGLLGMMKDEQLNTLLADFVRDLVSGSPWRVVVA